MTLFLYSVTTNNEFDSYLHQKILRKKTIYSIWELYPEIAQKLNELNSNLLLKSFKTVDNFCLKTIDEIVVNSNELKQYLIKNRGINNNKIMLFIILLTSQKVLRVK